MKQDYGKNPTVSVPRTAFNRSSGYKTMFDAGKLIPVCGPCEVFPGDTHKSSFTSLVRLASPLTVPTMDNVRFHLFHFFVPSRLLWTNWQKFMGEQEDPGDSIDFTIPIQDAPANGYLAESLGDYFGLPINEDYDDVNTLPFRAYNFIYDSFFRDENLVDSVTFPTDNGPDASTLYTVKSRAKLSDRFTRALPFLQKGDSVPLPLSGSAPITGIGKLDQVYSTTDRNVYETDATGTVTYPDSQYIDGTTATSQTTFIEEDPSNTGFPNIRADLAAATGATINEFREAVTLQHFLEIDARGGTRYIELLKAHFGVTSPDARLQRPEYLGGGTASIHINQVQQTGETGSTGQGNLAAFAQGTASGMGFNKSFTEHGYIISIANVSFDLTYQQGIEKLWSRSTRYDFPFPVFAHLGEQPIYSRELFADGSANDADVFGYEPRYNEIRSKTSLITGKLRSTYSAPLDIWHLAELFSSRPTLSETFITANTDIIDRVIVVQNEPQFVLDIYAERTTVRTFPTYGKPGLNRL